MEQKYLPTQKGGSITSGCIDRVDIPTSLNGTKAAAEEASEQE